MRAYLTLIPIIFLVIFGSSCRKNFEYAPSSGNLSFSKDTVYLDTVFTNIGSSTYSLKVYNETRDDILIPSITLANGENSGYRLNVDGAAGKSFKNISLFAKDSLFIFIEVTQKITAQQNSLLYTDAILFDSGIDLQEIPLITLIKDAVFIFPTTLANNTKEQVSIGLDDSGNAIFVNGTSLKEEQLHFTNEKPYVIYGYASVPSNKELIIDAGTRVHFHKNAGLVVQNKASLKINGVLSQDEELLEGEVIFEGDRLESEFENIPGQWGSIRFKKGSTNNLVNYTTIKNATNGIYVEGELESLNNQLQINNTHIYNSSNINLWSKTATISSKNIVLGNAGNTSLLCSFGGKYTFIHGTIANYWTQGFREGYALKITNEKDLISSEFSNCIIDGNKNNEITIEHREDTSFQISFTNCIIRTNITNAENPLLDFSNEDYYTNIYKNEDASFTEPSKNIFTLKNTSFAIDKGNVEKANLAPLDIKGTNRLSLPEIGAFEFFEIE
ncbi:hypothetical protein [uncultured Maribacter sp.]|uniref:hypothetical protein n=1 Tax=uncultured Maribacter sp. TaxID=431308 RepID=UPI0026158AA0|nr:hypothetical protein [uncultured Maribacter sp.]